MSVLSLDVGTNHCTILEGNARKGSVEIVQAVVARLPADDGSAGKGALSPFAYDVIAEAMKSVRFGAKRAVVTVNINNMIIRDFTLPDGPVKQLDSMVKNEMLHNYSASPADVIQFIKMPAASAAEEDEASASGSLRRKSIGAGAQTGIRAATVKKELVDSYYQLLKKLKFTPVAMDFHANAIEKLVMGANAINDTPVKDKNYLMVDFGSSGTLIHAAADNRVFISRYIPLGLNDLDQLLVDREFIPMEEARAFRREKLDLQSEDDAQGGPMKTARSFLYQWSDEIQKVLKFFMGRKGISEVECLYLYGSGSLIKGLPDYLSAAVGTKAARLETFSGITFKNGYDQAKLPYCLNAAGAAIRLS